jgi:Sulfotransferase domain
MRPLIDPTKDLSNIPVLLKLAQKVPRRITARFRLMPDFIIIGGQRCGTTTLYGLLTEHPCIVPALRKEVHYFERNFHRGISWYRSFFPLRLHKYYATKVRGRPLLSGEATAYYIFHPHAPKRILETLPDVKLIALLRNPVDRAYSHFQHEVRKRRENLRFEEAIEKEADRIKEGGRKMLLNESHDDRDYCYYSYLSRGLYVDQLELWINLFRKEQILTIRSEDLFTDPASVLQEAQDFLGVPRFELKEYRNYNDAKYPPMDPFIRKRLVKYFEPHNQRLYEFLGKDFAWTW